MSILKTAILFLLFRSFAVFAAGDLDDMTMEIILPEQPEGNQLQLPDMRELQRIDEHILRQPRETREMGVEATGIIGDATATGLSLDRGDDLRGLEGDAGIDNEGSLRHGVPDNIQLLRDLMDSLPLIEEAPTKSEVLLGEL